MLEDLVTFIIFPCLRKLLKLEVAKMLEIENKKRRRNQLYIYICEKLVFTKDILRRRDWISCAMKNGKVSSLISHDSYEHAYLGKERKP